MGRKSRSGMSGSGNGAVVKSFFDNLTASGPSKYTFIQGVADGKTSLIETAVNRILGDRMVTDARRDSMRKAVQEEASKWLKDNPKPAHPRKDGYTWDGKKYVRA